MAVPTSSKLNNVNFLVRDICDLVGGIHWSLIAKGLHATAP